MKEKPSKSYAIVPRNLQPPDYGRITRALSNSDLRHELALGRGDPGYQEELRREAKRRGFA